MLGKILITNIYVLVSTEKGLHNGFVFVPKSISLLHFEIHPTLNDPHPLDWS